METIKFTNRISWVILAAVIILIIVIAITSFRKKEEENTESKISKLFKRWQDLMHQIEEEMKSLKLTLEMQVALEKKIRNLFVLAKSLFAILFLIVVTILYLNTNELLSSLLNATAIFGFVGLAGSFIFVSKFVDPNTMIESGRELIRSWIYKKYGFDPEAIPVLEASIVTKQTEANQLVETVQFLQGNRQ